MGDDRRFAQRLGCLRRGLGGEGQICVAPGLRHLSAAGEQDRSLDWPVLGNDRTHQVDRRVVAAHVDRRQSVAAQ
jgi:hypothetical protein